MNSKKESAQELPLGTLETYSTMHKWLQRGLFVCLIALVFEATATVPLLLIWMGWPTLSPVEICSELTKVRYSDDSRECLFPHPLFSPSEAAGQTTAKDKWGVQPTPGYRRIGFRDLVKFRDERLARQAAARAAAQRDTEQTSLAHVTPANSDHANGGAVSRGLSSSVAPNANGL